MKTPFLYSSRLRYEPLSLAHLSVDYVGWLNDYEVCKYLVSGGNETIETLRKYLTEAEKKEMLFWAIIIQDTNKHIGNIKIDPVSEKNGLGEYGIMMGARDEWGKGYAKEASQTIIDYCFHVLNLRKITLGVVEDNAVAVKLYEKMGFITEGHFKEHEFYDGRFCNTLRMSLFNPAYTRS